jgi:hypothetical protein
MSSSSGSGSGSGSTAAPYKKSTCRYLTCELKTLSVLWCSGIGSV